MTLEEGDAILPCNLQQPYHVVCYLYLLRKTQGTFYEIRAKEIRTNNSPSSWEPCYLGVFYSMRVCSWLLFSINGRQFMNECSSCFSNALFCEWVSLLSTWMLSWVFTRISNCIRLFSTLYIIATELYEIFSFSLCLSFSSSKHEIKMVVVFAKSVGEVVKE